MDIPEPHKSWIKEKVGKDVNDKSRFAFKITARTPEGDVVQDINFDVVWFILIQVEDDERKKLAAALALLKIPDYLAAFQQVTANEAAQRVISEFLIFNFFILNNLKKYIDFTVLNDPIDFISHALFINYGEERDSVNIVKQRLATVKAVLSTGFKLPAASPVKSENVEVRKIIYMNAIEGKYGVVRKMLLAGFSLFGSDKISNNELAVELIDARTDPDCQVIIKENAQLFKALLLNIPGNDGPGNLADYYYWVKEDMQAVKFLKAEIGLDLTQTT